MRRPHRPAVRSCLNSPGIKTARKFTRVSQRISSELERARHTVLVHPAQLPKAAIIWHRKPSGPHREPVD
ncbi:hypothetical protein SRHO_G00208400 [Serrasalmus rhombeus]